MGWHGGEAVSPEEPEDRGNGIDFTKEFQMTSNVRQSRREFLRNAVMLAGAGVTAPLWAAMRYDRDAVMR